MMTTTLKSKPNIYLAILFCFVSSSVIWAQKKAELFCQLYVFGSDREKNKIHLDYGNKNHFYRIKDSTALSKLDSVKKFSNGIDAIDYLKEEGWEIVSISATKYNLWYTTVVYFKKEFER